MEGDYEIPTLSGSNPVYSDNLSSGSARSASPSNGVAGLSSSLFSKMKMTELYICGSGTGNHYDGLFNLTANTINQVKSFTNSEYIANTVVKTKAFDIDGDAHEDIAIASFDRENNTITLYIRLYNASSNNFSVETAV